MKRIPFILVLILLVVGLLVWHPWDTGNSVMFVCDDSKTIQATFYPQDDTHVDLVFSDGRSMSLPHAISASGARYASEDESFVFWNKGNTAFITENDIMTYTGCVIEGEVSDQWDTTTDTESGLVFRYPAELSTRFIESVDWPPQVQVLSGAYSCVEAGTSTDWAGNTEERTVRGNTFCVTKVSEGAAGSIYTQYAYVFPYNEHILTLTFSLQFSQCGNYDEEDRIACETERTAFNLDDLMVRIMETVAYQSGEQTASTFGNDMIEPAIIEYLLTQSAVSWKTEKGSTNLCVIENLDPEDELFPLAIWARCGEFLVEDGKVVETSGSSGPILIDYPNELSFYDINRFSYEMPGDGSAYAEDIKRLFSQKVQNCISEIDRTSLNARLEALAEAQLLL